MIDGDYHILINIIYQLYQNIQLCKYILALYNSSHQSMLTINLRRKYMKKNVIISDMLVELLAQYAFTY